MAIARDSAGTGITATGLATSITRAHTTSGSDRFLLASCETATITTDNITNVRYNGVTFFPNLVGLAQYTNGGDANQYLYYQIAPSTGASYNCVFDCSTADVFRCYTASYTGVDQTTPIDTSVTSTTDTVSGVDKTLTITVTASDCWAHLASSNNFGTPTAGTNATLLNTATAGPGYGVFDSNGTIGTGSYSMGWQVASAIGQGSILVAFKPAGAAATLTHRLMMMDCGI